MKLCKNCKWYSRFWLDRDLSKCRKPNSISIDPIGGNITYSFCRIERRDYSPLDTCGPGAKYFEPKETKQELKKQYERFKFWWK